LAGIFIVLEGVEGSGKSTQAKLLSSWLSEAGVRHRLTREPGGTTIGEEIRRALLHGGDMPARTELLLYLAARAALVEQVVRPALQAGEVVIADRYELSTFAYQAHGRGLPLEEVRAANRVATGGLQPDLTIVLELAPEVGEARRAAAGGTADRMERAGVAFHQAVSRAYRLLSQQDAGVVAVAGESAPHVVHDAIRRLLGSRFPETFPQAQGL
jgi:dTMP kinase